MYQKNYQKYFKYYLILLLALACFLGGLYFGRSKFIGEKIQGQAQNSIINKPKDNERNLDFALFWEVWDLLDQKFILKPIDQKKIFYGAVRGMVSALEDPYSVFMDPEETKKFLDEINGSFEGIGAEIGVREKNLTITSVLEGTPAEKAGLKAKDIILKINGDETGEMSLYQAVGKIRGPKGSLVKLEIYRQNEKEPLNFEIKRETVEIQTAKSEIKTDSKGEKVLYLRVTSFSENTSVKFDEVLDKGLKENPSKVILDLRSNSGGIAEQAVLLSSNFLPKDTLVFTEAFSDGRKEEFKSKRNPRLDKLPVVVLVNDGTASASEIMAGALRDNRGVKLVGEKTFGKGTVQQLVDLKDKSSLRVSVAKWLTPKGTDINKEGLVPDLEVKASEEDIKNNKDTVLEKALEIVAE